MSAVHPLEIQARTHFRHPLSKKLPGKPGDYDPISLTPEPQFRSMPVLDTLFLRWDNVGMLDLNDLRVFERVAAPRSSAASRT